MIKAITRMFNPASNSVFYSVEMEPLSVAVPYMFETICDEIAEKLATKYVEDYSAEFLKVINQKLIDAKVISKVIERLKDGKQI